MSQDIVLEVNFFLHSFLSGVIITFVYDWFLILRRTVRHNSFAVSLEDLIFWVACALGVFYMLYKENNGILRWFAVLGAGMGMLAYKRLVSTLWVKFVSDCILKVYRITIRPVLFVSKKISHLLSGIRQKGVLVYKFVKKKLTVRLKLIKMVLCKQKDKEVRSHGKKGSIPQKASE